MKTVSSILLLVLLVTIVPHWTYEVTIAPAYMYDGQWIFVPAGSEVYVHSCNENYCYIRYGNLPYEYYEGWIPAYALRDM